MGNFARIEPKVAKVEGLEQHHIATLVAVAEQINDPTGGASGYVVHQAMEQAGFTKLATILGLKALIDEDMLESYEETQFSGDAFTAYRVTDRGMRWLAANLDTLTLKSENSRPSSWRSPPPDAVPF